MWTWLRRVFWLSLVCGAGYAMYTAWQRKRETAIGDPPAWPPLDVGSASHKTSDDATAQSTDDTRANRDEGSSGGPSDRAWVEPNDGRCPDGFPIKANDKSGIFHVPGGRFYERTIPERCYPDEASAQADGYRRAKA